MLNFTSLNLSDPCEKRVCEHYSQCVSYDDGRTECACVDQCAQVDDPVCGSDGLDYSNECVLKATACRESRELDVTDDRPCGGKICPNMLAQKLIGNLFYKRHEVSPSPFVINFIISICSEF